MHFTYYVILRGYFMVLSFKDLIVFKFSRQNWPKGVFSSVDFWISNIDTDNQLHPQEIFMNSMKPQSSQSSSSILQQNQFCCGSKKSWLENSLL